MAKETTAPASNAPEAEATRSAKKSLSTMKLVQIGIPIFIVQAIAVYFLTAKFILPSAAAPDPGTSSETAEATRDHEQEAKPQEHEDAVPEEQNIYVVKDMIINPAGTNGTRFLLTTIGFNVSTPGAQKELEQKEMEVRDALNTVLAAKGLGELTDARMRDSLRVEISRRVGSLLKNGALRNVYFSKFIIQ